MHPTVLFRLWQAKMFTSTCLMEEADPSPSSRINEFRFFGSTGVIEVLSVNRRQALLAGVAGRSVESVAAPSRKWRCRTLGEPPVNIQTAPPHNDVCVLRTKPPAPPPCPATHPGEIDPLYLFARQVEWERTEEPSAGWELISATRSPHSETRANALALLASSHHLGGIGLGTASPFVAPRKRQTAVEDHMKAPYDLDIIEDCTTCPNANLGYFCGFSAPVLQALNQISHKSTLPAGAILFVEGQSPRGVFMVCSGKVNLSTTSREGKILILKTALAGDVLGLSASISGMAYEMTAETATPCQLNFIDRKHFMELMEAHSETGVHVAQCLSREYHAAYRDIHDLVLTRSSAGKLARLLLSQSPKRSAHGSDSWVTTPMTHEEMAQRIGASRETVTRLLTVLRKKQLIRLDGPTLIIRDRTGLEALTG